MGGIQELGNKRINGKKDMITNHKKSLTYCNHTFYMSTYMDGHKSINTCLQCGHQFYDKPKENNEPQ